MTDNTLNLDALTEAFKADCKVIRLKYEYPGYTGTEKYAIISDLSYEQIVEKHAPVVKQYIPFLLLSKAAGEVFAEFKRNEDKFFKRMQRDDSYGFEDGTTELYNSGICVPDFTGELFEEEKDSRIVWAAFARLNRGNDHGNQEAVSPVPHHFGRPLRAERAVNGDAGAAPNGQPSRPLGVHRQD